MSSTLVSRSTLTRYAGTKAHRWFPGCWIPDSTLDMAARIPSGDVSSVLPGNDPRSHLFSPIYHLHEPTDPNSTTKPRRSDTAVSSANYSQSLITHFFPSSSSTSSPDKLQSPLSMRIVANKWCRTRSDPIMGSLFVGPDSPFLLLINYSSPWYSSFENLMTDSYLSSLYQHNTIVHNWMVLSSEFIRDHEAELNRGIDIRNSFTVPWTERGARISFLVRIRKLVQPVKLFFVHVSNTTHWGFDYMVIAGVEDKKRISKEELMSRISYITQLPTSPPHDELGSDDE